LIEIAASAVVVWQLKGSDKTREGARLLSRRVDFVHTWSPLAQRLTS
jgi:hypothetical protein